MSKDIASTLSAALHRLLRPVARICLRNGLPYGAFADVAKRVFVEVATAEFDLPGRKQSVSRVSVLTGLTRKEISRIQELPPPDDSGAAERHHRAARVVSGWVRDPEFAEPGGWPAHLPLDGESGSFSALVKRYSGDVPVRAILDELVRVGAAERLAGGKLRLLRPAYLPTSGEMDKLPFLGTDAADFIATIDHNLRARPEDAYVQRKVVYDNLPQDAASELRPLATRKAQALLEDLDRWLAAHDRDANPAVAGEGRLRAGVGVYYFEERLPQEE
jgi:hypothetical protein